jgi:hypothetical protein
MRWGSASGSIPGEAVERWRHGAANVLLVASAVGFLPAIVLLLAGLGPPVATPVVACVIVAYLVVLVGALCPRANYRKRILAMLAIGYALAFMGTASLPGGPFPRAMLIIIPMLATVLLGARAGRGMTLISAGVLLFAPFLHN